MKQQPNTRGGAGGLRRRAEHRMREQPAGGTRIETQTDTQRILHELQVHQIELELQNEELKQSKAEVEAGLEKYTDLYDFAPVGYFTLTVDSTIRLVNLTGARLVGLERSRLVGRPFGLLVCAELRPAFNSFLKQVFADPAKQSGDFELLSRGQAVLAVNIEAQRLLNGLECRVVVVDISDRKRVEAATAQLAAIVTSSSDAIIGEDLNSIVTSWNAGAERIFGYSASEMVGRPISRLIPPVRQQEEAQIMSRILKGESVVNFDTLRVAKDGRLLDLSVAVSPIRYRTGKITGAAKVARDITDRKRAEDKVRVSEIRYRRIFEATHDGVLLLDPDTGKITDANPFMTELLDYPRDELIGRELFEIGLLKDEAASREMFEKLKKTREVRYEDLPLESRGGRHQEVEVVASLYEENGHSVIQCNVRDITARKQAEEMLRRNEALFSALVTQAPVGVYVVDAGFHLQQANPKALPVFKNVRPLVGRDFSEIIHVLWPKRVADQVVERFRHTLKTGEPYQAPAFAERRRDLGVKEIYEWQIQRVTLPAGEHGVVCFFNNITGRVRAESAQRRLDVLTATNAKLKQEITRRQAVETALTKSERRAHQLLEQARRLQKKLRHVSHQVVQVQENQRKEISRELHDKISQLLIGINVHLAIFSRTAAVSPQGIRRTLAPLRRLVGKSVRVVHQFARELRPAMLDDLGLIPALRSYIHDFPKRKGRQIQFTAYAGVEALNNDKRTVLYRVTQEALTNVAKHAQAHVVKVTILKAPGGVCLEIADDGKAFEVGSLSSSPWGDRLGLIGMRERVEMVGGRFSVVSTPGMGTTVRAEVPFGRQLPRIAHRPLGAGGGGGSRQTNPRFR